MKSQVRPFREELGSPADVLLADTAIRIQLSRTDYGKAEERYRAINDWLDRAGSPLRGYVRLLYPQGSMAIGATIASKLRTDEYDIDVVVELGIALDSRPKLVLDLLYKTIRGEPGSRYYAITERRTRCVTIHYADGMHLDLTPVALAADQQPKISIIFHHKPGDPNEYRRWANPWGFAEWFKEKTPPDQAFAMAFDARADSWERAMRMEKAEAEPVPPQEGAHEKSKAVIIHQLIKRWRNVCFDSRNGVRRPPSVAMAKVIAETANGTATLSEELLVQAYQLRETIRAAHWQGQRVLITNPKCEADLLTDRWPASLDDQAMFLRDLDDLVAKAARLQEGCGLPEMKAIMADLFGENPTTDVFKAFNESLGRRVALGHSASQRGSGRLVGISSSPAMVAAPTPLRTRPHTFFGSYRG